MIEEIAFVERTVRYRQGTTWREHWEPASGRPLPAGIIMISRDPHSGEPIGEQGFVLAWRHEVIG